MGKKKILKSDSFNINEMIRQRPKNSGCFTKPAKILSLKLRIIPQDQQGQYLYPYFTEDKIETWVQVACPGQIARQYFLTV